MRTKTSRAMSVRQSNKILRLVVASSRVFYLSDFLEKLGIPQLIKNCTVLYGATIFSIALTTARPFPPILSIMKK